MHETCRALLTRKWQETCDFLSQGERRSEQKMLRFLRPNERWCHFDELMLSLRKWVLMKLQFRNWNGNVPFPELSYQWHLVQIFPQYMLLIVCIIPSCCSKPYFLQSSHFICLFSHQAPSEFSSSLRAISVLPHHFMTIVFAFAPVFSSLGIWTEIEMKFKLYIIMFTEKSYFAANIWFLGLPIHDGARLCLSIK